MMIMTQSIRAMPTPMTEVEEHLIEATAELFDAYGISLGRLGEDENPTTLRGAMITSTVGFAGENIRGALILATSIDVVRTWQMQLGSNDPSLDAAGDTIGEFSNMLLGRLKYSLLLRGVTILLATPITAMGEHITFPAPSDCPSRWLRFGGDVGRLDVRFDASFTADFAFATEAPRDVPANAGDMMMF
jgi:hypothetical protein